MNAWNSRPVWAVLMLALMPGLVGAQESGWHVRAVGEFGFIYPTRNLGKNIGNLQEQILLQAVASMDAAPLVGAALEVESAERQMVLRLSGRTTLGARASGKLGVCNIATGAICLPREADARMTLFAGEVEFVQGNPTQMVRPILMAGVGARTYSFTVEPCPATGTSEQMLICETIGQIFEEPAQVQPFLQFGGGLQAQRGPLSAYIRLQDIVGQYRGGTGNSSGEFQNDVIGLVGARITIR